MDSKKLQHFVEASAAGDKVAFGALYDALYDKVYSYAYRRTYSRSASEDIVSNVFYKLMANIPGFKYKNESSFYAWLFKISYNEINMYYRMNNKYVPAEKWLEASQENPINMAIEQEIDNELANNELRMALSRLNDTQRSIVELYYFANLDHKTIAKTLGKREGAVRTALSRSLRQLQSSMDNHVTKEALI